MIHQEEIYQLIFKEKWQDILDILYQHKEDIANDTIMQYAAITFETEFFKKVSDYAIDNKIINDNLDTLYALHHGKFYLLKPESLKILTIKMVRRNRINEAYNYALQCPKDDICKDDIKKYESQFGKQGSETQIVQTQTSRNWIEIYNRLFELINEKDDAATYFTGPRFIKVIKEFNPYFPDYTQYIELSNQQGKSTSRKIFYYDILLEQDEPIRLKIIDSILNIVKPFQPEKVIAIEMILGKQSIDVSVVASTEIHNEQSMHPVVFISYSWDDEAHKE